MSIGNNFKKGLGRSLFFFLILPGSVATRLKKDETIVWLRLAEKDGKLRILLLLSVLLSALGNQSSHHTPQVTRSAGFNGTFGISESTSASSPKLA